MYLSYPPRSYRWMLPRSIQWNLAPGEGRRVAITFDDGPDPATTPQVLDILMKHKAKATFFCIGKNLEKYPELMQAILQQGHKIGNHGYSHLDGWRTGTLAYYKDVIRCEQICSSGIYRPPFGRIRPNQAKALSGRFQVVMWSLLSGDFDRRKSASTCLNLLYRKTTDGDIVVFHDNFGSAARMLPILPKYLDFLRDGSYFFDQWE